MIPGNIPGNILGNIPGNGTGEQFSKSLSQHFLRIIKCFQFFLINTIYYLL